MHINNIFGETIEVTDLAAAITEAQLNLNFAKNAAKDKNHPVKFITRGTKKVTLVKYHTHIYKQLKALKAP